MELLAIRRGGFLQAQPGPRWPALSVGVANIASTTNDRTRTGQPFWYGVLSQDLKYLRLHGGYGLQRDRVEARKWYEKAAEKGMEESKKALQRLR